MTPDTVTAAPACHVARPNTRAIGPISETNAIIDMEQAMLATINGRKSKAGVVMGESSVSFYSLREMVARDMCKQQEYRWQ
jgi:hypothetical protein